VRWLCGIPQGRKVGTNSFQVYIIPPSLCSFHVYTPFSNKTRSRLPYLTTPRNDLNTRHEATSTTKTKH
jgi:hypothetical protein